MHINAIVKMKFLIALCSVYQPLAERRCPEGAGNCLAVVCRSDQACLIKLAKASQYMELDCSVESRQGK